MSSRCAVIEQQVCDLDAHACSDYCLHSLSWVIAPRGRSGKVRRRPPARHARQGLTPEIRGQGPKRVQYKRPTTICACGRLGHAAFSHHMATAAQGERERAARISCVGITVSYPSKAAEASTPLNSTATASPLFPVCARRAGGVGICGAGPCGSRSAAPARLPVTAAGAPPAASCRRTAAAA